jgi:IS4 transposase
MDADSKWILTIYAKTDFIKMRAFRIPYEQAVYNLDNISLQEMQAILYAGSYEGIYYLDEVRRAAA